MRTECRSGSRRIGASRGRIRPGEPLPRRLAAGDLLTNCKICEKVRLVLCVALGLVSGCSKKGFDERSLGPPEVLVTDVTQQDVPVVREWIGSLDGSVNADIR